MFWHNLSQDSLLFHRSGGVSPVSAEPTCTCTTAHACEVPHTWELGLTFLTTSYTCIRATHAGFGGMSTQNGMSNGGSQSRLICGPWVVYPLDRLRKGVRSLVDSLLVCVGVGHMSMQNQVGAQALTRFHPVDPKCEFSSISPEPSK